MRTVFLATGLLLLAACNGRHVTTVTIASDGDAGINSSQASLRADTASFRCIGSSSGRCNYVVFLNHCNSDGAAATTACTTRSLEQFTLKAGESRQLHGLPAGFQFCVSHGAKPVAPACST